MLSRSFGAHALVSSRQGFHSMFLRSFSSTLYEKLEQYSKRPRSKKQRKYLKNVIRNRGREDPDNIRGRTRRAEYYHPPDHSPQLKEFLKPDNFIKTISEVHKFGSVLTKEPDFSRLDSPQLIALPDSASSTSTSTSASGERQEKPTFADRFGPTSGVETISEALAILDLEDVETASPKPGSEKENVNVVYRRLIELCQMGQVEEAMEIYSQLVPQLVSTRRKERAQAAMVRMLMRFRSHIEASQFVETNVIVRGERALPSDVVAALLNGCMNRGDPRRARRMIDSLQARFDFEKTTGIFYCIAKLTGLENNGYEARNVLHEFETERLNIVLLRMLDLNNANEWMEAHLTRGIYHHVMLACARDNATAKFTFDVYEKLLATGLPANETTLTNLMVACASLNDVGLAKRVWKRFRSAHPNVVPAINSYNSVFSVYANHALFVRKPPPKMPAHPNPQERTPRLDEARELIRVLTFMPKDTLFNPKWRNMLVKNAEEIYIRREEKRIAAIEKEDDLMLEAMEKARGLPDSAFPDLEIDDADFDEDDMELMPVYNREKTIDFQQGSYLPDLQHPQMREFLEDEMGSDEELSEEEEFEKSLESLRGILEMGADSPEQVEEILEGHRRRFHQGRQALVSGSSSQQDSQQEALESETGDSYLTSTMTKVFAEQVGMPEESVIEVVNDAVRENQNKGDGVKQEVLLSMFADLDMSEDQVMEKVKEMHIAKTRPQESLDDANTEKRSRDPLPGFEYQTKAKPMAAQQRMEPMFSELPFADPDDFHSSPATKIAHVTAVDELGLNSLSSADVDEGDMEFAQPLDFVAHSSGRRVSRGSMIEEIIHEFPAEKMEADIEAIEDNVMADGSEEPEYDHGLFENPDDVEYIPEDQPADVHVAAMEYFDEIVTNHDVKPSVSTLNSLLKVFVNGLRLNRAEHVVTELFPKFGLQPDKLTYRNMVMMYSEARRWAKVQEYFDLSLNLVGNDYAKMDQRTLGSMIRAYSYQNRTDEAMQLLEIMKENCMYISESYVHNLRKKLEAQEAPPEVLAKVPQDPYKWVRPDVVRHKLNRVFNTKEGRIGMKKLVSASHTAQLKLLRRR